MTAAVVCSRCGGPLEPAGFYGPCEPCRQTIRADAHTGFAARLNRVAAALSDGWVWDDTDACWRRGDETQR